MKIPQEMREAITAALSSGYTEPVEVTTISELGPALYVKPAADVGSPAKEIADKISKAMEGVTPGPWSFQYTDEKGECFIIAANLGGMVGASLPWPSEVEDRDFRRVIANAKYITACNPDNMRVLLSAMADAERERDEQRDARLRFETESVRRLKMLGAEKKREEARAESAEAKLAEAVKVIEWCLARDERNGSLPEAYADKLGAFIASMKGGDA